EQCGRSEPLVSLRDHQLSLLAHVPECDPDQRVVSRRQRLAPQHGPGHPLDGSRILLHAAWIISAGEHTPNVSQMKTCHRTPSVATGFLPAASSCATACPARTRGRREKWTPRRTAWP